MRVTVCELANDSKGLVGDWDNLVKHVRREESELVLLPELPFFPWPFANREFNQETWDESVSAHDEWIGRLGELTPAAVLGTRPVTTRARRLNQSFVWTEEAGYRAIHAKCYLPNEDGFWEASWYDRGDNKFVPHSVRGTKVGFLICSELWSMQHAVQYGEAGVHVIMTPRATERATVEKWLVGGRACSVVSGCFSLSSNRISRSSNSGNLGGMGWIVDPDGNVLGTTSRERPFLSLDVDVDVAVRSKKTYPRYTLFT